MFERIKSLTIGSREVLGVGGEGVGGEGVVGEEGEGGKQPPSSLN